jgi:L-threonylcarbamoyladenylate synthase
VIEEVVAAIRAGEPVVLPTDTVYGLAADAANEEAVRRLYRLKGREDAQPSGLLAADEETVYAALPELRGFPLLRGPYTLVVPNPARRFPWLTGGRAETLGIRIPAVEGEALEVLRQVGLLASTSANLPGGPDPKRLDEVPQELRDGCGAVLDGGELPGKASTIVDVTGDEPVVLREGAVPAAEALAELLRA